MIKTKGSALRVMLFLVSLLFCSLLLPTNLLAVDSSEVSLYTAKPLVKMDINTESGNSAGIFIGIQEITNPSGEAVQDIHLAGYQIEIDYNSEKVTVLNVINEANMENFTKSIVDQEGKLYIAGATNSETVNYNKLVFVPLVVNSSVKDLTSLSVKFTKVIDADLNEISIPEQYLLNLQRGKVINQETVGDPSIADALAGLQYLGKNRVPGVDKGQVNLINMGSISQTETQTDIVEPDVKDIISLMQYLVHTRNDYFEPVIPQASDLAITSVSALTVDGRVLSVEFNKAISSVSKSEVKIVNPKTLARIGVESVELSEDGKTLEVKLYDNSATTGYVIEYLTDYTITVRNLSFTFQRYAFRYGRIVDIDADNRTISIDGNLLKVPPSTTFDFQASLGAKVRVWFNRDSNLIGISYDNQNVVTGKLEVIQTPNYSGSGKVAINGVEYDLAHNFAFYNNDETNPMGFEGTEYDYAKVFLDTTGEIEFIVSYNFDDCFIVKSTEGNVAISYDNDELNLEDCIIFKEEKSLLVSDLKEGDIIYFSNNSNNGDGIAEVYNNSVTGEIEAVYSDSIKIGGINYHWLNGRFGSARYLDGDEFSILDTDKAEEYQAGGPVTAYLDRYGDIVYLVGTGITSNLNIVSAYNVENIIAYWESGIPDRGTLDLEVINEDGDIVTKSLRVSELDKVTVTTDSGSMVYEPDEYYPGYPIEIEGFGLVGNGSDIFDLVAFDSNHNQIGEVIKQLTPTNTLHTVFRYTADDLGKIKGLEFLTSSPLTAPLELDDNYVTTSFNKYRLQSDTVVYNVSEGFDAEDISISTWSELANNNYNILAADVYADEDNNVMYLVIKETGPRHTQGERTDYNAVITQVFRNSDNEVVEIQALVDGTRKTYVVDNIWSSIAKGQSVVLSINNASELVEEINLLPEKLFTGVVMGIDVANRTVIVDGIQFKLITGGDVYDATDTSDITLEPFRNISMGDTVDILLDEAGTCYAEVITIRNF